MQIFSLDDETLQAGRDAFRNYSNWLLCYYNDTAANEPERRHGVGMVPGAALACIEAGITQEYDVLTAVGRVTSCRASTVERVLDAFAGDVPGQHLWTVRRGRYSVLPGARSGGWRNAMLTD